MLRLKFSLTNWRRFTYMQLKTFDNCDAHIEVAPCSPTETSSLNTVIFYMVLRHFVEELYFSSCLCFCLRNTKSRKKKVKRKMTMTNRKKRRRKEHMYMN